MSRDYDHHTKCYPLFSHIKSRKVLGGLKIHESDMMSQVVIS